VRQNGRSAGTEAPHGCSVKPERPPSFIGGMNVASYRRAGLPSVLSGIRRFPVSRRNDRARNRGPALEARRLVDQPRARLGFA